MIDPNEFSEKEIQDLIRIKNEVLEKIRNRQHTRSDITYFDENNQICEKERACSAVIREFNESGELVNETFGVINKDDEIVNEEDEEVNSGVHL